ncbi:MAG: AMP-binding protein, partial [Acidimicrobiia bacterium]
MNLASVLLRHAESRPDAVALVEDETQISFGELLGLTAATAGSLVALGVAPGDRVAIACWNDSDFVRTYLGALWCGAVAVPINPSSPAVVQEAEMARVGARVLVCGAGAEHLLELP